MTKIALLQPAVMHDWEKGFKDYIINQINKNVPLNKFELVPDTKSADLIVLLESCNFKTQKNIQDFNDLLDFGKHGKRICTINYEDAPAGFLPGIYSSLEKDKFDPGIHISWPHLIIQNEFMYQEEALELPAHLCRLFTFSGACSNPVRRKIFNFYEHEALLYKVKEVNRWYNHSLEEKKSYVDDIKQSKFVLCPKGIASYSHRILETMALGRVPVIIADDWVPFSIPEKGYYVMIKEGDVANIVQILEQKAVEYESLQSQTLQVYNKYFSMQERYSVALNQLVFLYKKNLTNINSDYLKKRWNSRKFWKQNKWCIEDRIRRKFISMTKSFGN